MLASLSRVIRCSYLLFCHLLAVPFEADGDAACQHEEVGPADEALSGLIGLGSGVDLGLRRLELVERAAECLLLLARQLVAA